MSEKAYTIEQINDILNNSSVNIRFKKKDGTDREMLATKNLTIIPEKFHPKNVERKKLPENIITVFDLNIDEWRSFDYNNFLGFC
jgi:hypothetical protein